jgi:hypothetical protein
VKRVRGKRKLVWIPIVAMLVLSMVGVGTASPGKATVYVDPEVSSMPVGLAFDIVVKVDDAEDLWLAEFEVNYHPGILRVRDDWSTVDIEGINVAPGSQYMEVVWVEDYGVHSPDLAWLLVVAGRPLGVKTGMDGTVSLAKITFEVIAEGYCDLHLYSIDLLNPMREYQDHLTNDGYFEPMLTWPMLYMQTEGARVYPQWKKQNYVPSLTNTLFAKVVNNGTADGTIKVKFIIGVVELWSNVGVVPAGGSTTVSGVFPVPGPGTYFVNAEVYWKTTSDWTPWSEVQGELGGIGVSKDIATRFKAS